MRKSLRFWWTIAAVAALLLAGVMSINQAAYAQDGASGLKVMTYNIKHGNGNDECTDPTPAEGEIPQAECSLNLGRTADVIRAQDADVVALQEVDRFWARSGGVDEPQELANLLDMDVCFGANLSHEADNHADVPHEYGTAILSKYPIMSCENTFLPTPEGWEQRGLLGARINVDGIGEVAILDTHLQAGRKDSEEEAARQRTEQAQVIADRVAELVVPAVLMGDFNANPDDPELDSLRGDSSDLQDAWEVAGDGDGFTIPVSADADPENRIDFIFATPQWNISSAEVLINDDTRITSDHYPVVAELELSGDATPAGSPVASPEGDDGLPQATPVT